MDIGINSLKRDLIPIYSGEPEVNHPRFLPSPNLYGYPYPSEEGPDPYFFFGGMTVRC